jgi:hypothetical protein
MESNGSKEGPCAEDSAIPSSWLEYFPGEEFKPDDRRAVLLASLADFLQTHSARHILAQVWLKEVEFFVCLFVFWMLIFILQNCM